jgi:two-component system, OmpR family, response regulator
MHATFPVGALVGRTMPAMNGTILLVEDERSIASLVRTYLERDGFQVVHVTTGEDALAELPRHPIRLIVLDIGLPGIDGFEVCRRVRAKARTPIIMLTARDDEVDRVAGLEVGADDYVSKPFSPRELVARVKAVLRRAEPPTDAQILTLGPIALDVAAREVRVDQRDIELTAKEFDLLRHLMENPGVVLSREVLLDRVWGMRYPGETRTVEVHVGQLRKKLGLPDAIRTMRGAGYKAVAP